MSPESRQKDPLDGGDRQDRILVLGIGNLLWADEGFGVRAVEALDAAWRFPPRVRLIDGGTQGLALLPYVRAACGLLILDAIDFGLPPGEVRLIRDDDVPRYMGAKKVSMHQTGFQEVLAAARMLREYPERLALIGVQPVTLDDYGGGLTAEVSECLPRAVATAVEILSAWGVTAQPCVATREHPEATEHLWERAALRSGRQPG